MPWNKLQEPSNRRITGLSLLGLVFYMIGVITFFIIIRELVGLIWFPFTFSETLVGDRVFLYQGWFWVLFQSHCNYFVATKAMNVFWVWGGMLMGVSSGIVLKNPVIKDRGLHKVMQIVFLFVYSVLLVLVVLLYNVALLRNGLVPLFFNTWSLIDVIADLFYLSFLGINVFGFYLAQDVVETKAIRRELIRRFLSLFLIVFLNNVFIVFGLRNVIFCA